eukprot:m.100291 g.100291  ORF g.100291 m.100291 type:complete len:471 (-) comp12550_c0_seq7:121-1533(-)
MNRCTSTASTALVVVVLVNLCFVCAAQDESSVTPTGEVHQIVEAATVPFVPKVKLEATSGNVVVDLPDQKSLRFMAHTTLDIDEARLAENVDMMISQVMATTNLLKAHKRNSTENIATNNLINTLTTQISALQTLVDMGSAEDTAGSLKSIVGNLDHLTNVADDVAMEKSKMLEEIVLQSEKTQHFANDLKLNKLSQDNSLRTYDGDASAHLSSLKSRMLNTNSKLLTLVDQYNDVGDQSQKQVEDITGSLDMSTTIDQVNQDIKLLTSTRLGTNNHAIMKWAVWSTYAHCCGWFNGNGYAWMYGGVPPSTWGDGVATAAYMTQDADIMRTLFNKRAFCGKSCMIWSEEWSYSDTSNSRHVAVLMRVRNTTPQPLTWDLSFIYSSSGSNGELASVALNFQNQWSYSGSCNECEKTLTLSLEPSQTNTIIVLSSSGAPTSTRTLHLSFIQDSLSLPNGAEWVDDLDTVAFL